MSGHSKWHSIKHQKAKEDKKKGQVFSRLVREITVSARQGGGDPAMNARLRLAVEKASEANMPKDNIEKAIKRGTGELPGVSYVEVTYEGYGPGGVAIMVNAATDNKNRTASQMRRIFSDHGGNLGETGCLSWMFQKKGYISVGKEKIPEEELLEKVIDLDIEDLKTDEKNYYEILSEPEKFSQVSRGISEFVEADTAEITMIPSTFIKLSGREAKDMLRLMESLEENDDVQQVFANFDISSEDMEEVQ